MKLSKLWFVLLTLALVLASVGCTSNDLPKKPDQESSDTASEETTEGLTSNLTSESTEEPTPPPDQETPEFLEKVGTIDGSINYFIGTACITYDRQTQQYKVVNIEKNQSSEATYVNAEEMNGFFVVKQQRPSDKNDFTAINSTGVLNADLEQTIPCEYALIRTITDGYVVAYKATEITENKDDYLLYMTSNIFSLTPEEGDVLYKGEWCVIELATGRKLEGLCGTESPTFFVNGDVIIAKVPDDQYIRVSFSGKAIPDDVNLLVNGCYIPYSENTVYTSDGKKLFDFEKGASVSAVGSGTPYLFQVGVMDKTSYKTYYTIVDKAGTPVSIAFENYPSTYCNNFVVRDNVVYLFDGTKIAEGTVSSINRQGSHYLIKFQNRIMILDQAYNTVLDLTTDNLDDLYIDYKYFLIGKPSENYTTTYYSLPQKDFVYNGNPLGPWIVQVKLKNGNSIIVNTLTDEVLMPECKISLPYMDAEGNIYVVVENDDGLKDIYRIKNT